MQEEILKHTKKVYSEMKNTDHSFWHKTKEILIEIGIIVFAVTLSIWLHSWSEHRHQQKEVKSFLTNLKSDLTKDITSLNDERSEYLRLNKEYEILSNITSTKLDSLIKAKSFVKVPIHTTGKKTNDGNYEGFKTSGKLGYVENEELKQLFIKYYQQTVPMIDEVDKIYSGSMFKMIDFKIDNAGQSDKIKYTNPKFTEISKYIIMIGNNNVRVYDDYGIKDAKEIIKQIDIELQK